MNLSDFPPFDESVQGRALTPATISRDSRSGALFEADLVRSNMQMEWSSGMPDIPAIKRRAEAMRTAYIRSVIQAAFAAIENWFARRQQQDLEDYLAGSQTSPTWNRACAVTPTSAPRSTLQCRISTEPIATFTGD
jgi:hypothetical protein